MRLRNLIATGFACLVVSLTGCSITNADLAERQEAVAAAGAEVMPFDLEATTHIFTDTSTGGIQDVVADDPDDQANISSIREHLRIEAAKFKVGDFSDPEAIHGPDMPGLQTLKSRYSEIDVTVSSSDYGATINYVTSDPVLVRTIHDWFNAQTSDHGSHAEHGSS